MKKIKRRIQMIWRLLVSQNTILIDFTIKPKQNLKLMISTDEDRNISILTLEAAHKYLKAESEIGASDADAVQHGTYAVDGNSECEADSTGNPEHTSSAAMETRIDLENLCVCVSPDFHKDTRTGNIICLKCTNLHITHINE